MFHRYHDAFALMDAMIGARRFLAFVNEATERRADDYYWDMWLHKCFDGTSFEKYKMRLLGRNAQHITAPTDEQAARIAADSLSMLEGFSIG